MKPSIFTKWFQDFPKKKKIVETKRGFKKTVQNQKYTSTVMKKLCNLHNFLYKRTAIDTKNSELMSELLPNENGFKRKNSQMLKFYQNPKLPYYILHIFKPKYISKLP